MRGPGKPRSRIMSRTGASDSAPTDCTVVKPAINDSHALLAIPEVALGGGLTPRGDPTGAIEVRIEVHVGVDPAGKDRIPAQVDDWRSPAVVAASDVIFPCDTPM